MLIPLAILLLKIDSADIRRCG